MSNVNNSMLFSLSSEVNGIDKCANDIDNVFPIRIKSELKAYKKYQNKLKFKSHRCSYNLSNIPIDNLWLEVQTAKFQKTQKNNQAGFVNVFNNLNNYTSEAQLFLLPLIYFKFSYETLEYNEIRTEFFPIISDCTEKYYVFTEHSFLSRLESNIKNVNSNLVYEIQTKIALIQIPSCFHTYSYPKYIRDTIFKKKRLITNRNFTPPMNSNACLSYESPETDKSSNKVCSLFNAGSISSSMGSDIDKIQFGAVFANQNNIQNPELLNSLPKLWNQNLLISIDYILQASVIPKSWIILFQFSDYYVDVIIQSLLRVFILESNSFCKVNRKTKKRNIRSSSYNIILRNSLRNLFRQVQSSIMASTLKVAIDDFFEENCLKGHIFSKHGVCRKKLTEKTFGRKELLTKHSTDLDRRLKLKRDFQNSGIKNRRLTKYSSAFQYAKERGKCNSQTVLKGIERASEQDLNSKNRNTLASKFRMEGDVTNHLTQKLRKKASLEIF